MKPIKIRRRHIVKATEHGIQGARRAGLTDRDAERLREVAATTSELDLNFTDEGHGGCIATQAGMSALHAGRITFAFAFDESLIRRYWFFPADITGRYIEVK